jgi:hypothetical protein
MTTGYQDEVFNEIDYKLVETPFGFHSRSPICLGDHSLSQSISFLGAAQTLGVWCEFPFPTLVANALSVRPLNLGHAGAGPRAFLNKDIIDCVNKTKLCIIQVMSGRSTSNRFMRQTHGAARVRLMHPQCESSVMLGHLAYAEIFPHLSQQEMRDLVNESLHNYLDEYKELDNLIRVPKILLWISSRSPYYNRTWDNVDSLLGKFPHLIDEPTWQTMCSIFPNHVEAVSSDFIKRPLWSERHQKNFTIARRWGEVKTYGPHYAHPRIHILAANNLLDKVRELDII